MLINPIISIHAPRTGSDSIKSISAFISLHFNPRSPHGERQRCVFGMASGGYFNPRSPHGERPANAAALPSCICISIHAPRTGSDIEGALKPGSLVKHFNPRSPHGERQICKIRLGRPHEFQSTLPARGATSAVLTEEWLRLISIHAPRTGSDVLVLALLSDGVCISIHAPRTGSDRVS